MKIILDYNPNVQFVTCLVTLRNSLQKVFFATQIFNCIFEISTIQKISYTNYFER